MYMYTPTCTSGSLRLRFCQPPRHSALSLWYLCPSWVPTIPFNVSDSSVPRRTIHVYHTLLHLMFPTDKQWLKANVKQCHSAHLLHSCKLWPPRPTPRVLVAWPWWKQKEKEYEQISDVALQEYQEMQIIFTADHVKAIHSFDFF